MIIIEKVLVGNIFGYSDKWDGGYWFEFVIWL